MPSLAELEALLQRSLDRDVLEVYADALQAAGDARGELIAIDLQPRTPALAAARAAAERRWLGDARGLPGFTHELGLCEVWLAGDAGALAALLASPLAGCLRSLSVHGDADAVRRALIALAQRPLPWLTRLAIERSDRGTLMQRAVAVLAEAAPHLRALELRGRHVLASPLPASITQLTLHGGSTLIIDSPLPGVRELALTFAAVDEAALRELAPLVNPRSFPDLTRLDLAGNELMYPRAHPSNLDALRFVAAIDAPERLRWLRLPSLRTAEQVAAVRALLDAHPALAIEIARGYRELAAIVDGLSHPRLRLPPLWPWPPADRLPIQDAVVITAGDRAEAMSIADCTDALEASFADLPAAARAGWIAFWDAIEGLPDAGPRRALPAGPLRVALAALAARPGDDRRARVLALLRTLPAEAEVALSLSRDW